MELKYNMEYVSYRQIMEQLDEIGEGDIIYVVSDIFELVKISRENGERFDRNLFIDTLQQKVGSSGTLLVPTFNWDFCRGVTFDYYKTPCKTGALGVAALNRNDFVRTNNPIYSFAVWGRDAELLAEMECKSCFGEDSIFYYMHEKNAKALVIGLDVMDGLTFMHYVEQSIGVPFRYNKVFTAGYVDKNGIESVREYSMYVRDLSINAKESTKGFSGILETLGASKSTVINTVPFRVVDLSSVYDIEAVDIKMHAARNLYVW